MCRVFVVDDHPIVRSGLVQLLSQEEEFQVIGEADRGEVALEKLQTTTTDVAVVDLSLPGMSGLELVTHLSKIKVKCLVLSMHSENLFADRAFRSGARGYMVKDDAIEKLIPALKKIQDGKFYISEHMMNRFEFQHGNLSKKGKPPRLSESLSNREFEVFRLIGKGMSTREISNQMERSVKTVESYKERIKEKLHLENSCQLLRYAVLLCDSSS